jgi:hypothetical protein
LHRAAAQRSKGQSYIQGDIHEGTRLDDAECVGAIEADNADTVLVAADLHNGVF